MTTPSPDHASSSDAALIECENCGAHVTETEPVRRVYLDLEAPSDPEAATVEEQVEQWCVSCLANYPHQAAPTA